MQITKQEIRNIRKELGLTIRETARILDCTEKTVYNKENPANEPADLVWYYAMRWVELGKVDVPFEGITVRVRLIPCEITPA